MHPYIPAIFSGLDDIPDAAIEEVADGKLCAPEALPIYSAIEEVADDKLCVPDDPIEALPFNFPDDSCFCPPMLEDGFLERREPLSQKEQKGGSPDYSLRGRVPKKLRTKRFGRQLWSLYPPLWLLNSTATCFEAKKTCMHCRALETPQWRTGPAGPATLCNACGIRFKSGRLLPEYRPLASPTHTDTDYSNRHKKVLKIREKKTG